MSTRTESNRDMISAMQKWRIVLGVLFVGAIVSLLMFLQMSDLMISFSSLKEARMEIQESLMTHPVRGVAIFMFFYISAVALSLPFALPLTVFSGFLFGSIYGTFVVAVSATTGATIIFILARFFFRNFFTKKLGSRLEVVNRELSSHGFRDILILRLTPVIPFSLINAATALTSVRLKHYVLGTLVGTVPFTFVYVEAGTRLAEIDMLSDILSLRVAFTISLIVILGTLPILIRRRRQKRNFVSQNEQ